MRRRLGLRRVRLALSAWPGRRRWHGGRCVKHARVGDGSDDPPEPELTTVFAYGGKPFSWRIVGLVGIDTAWL